MKKYKVITFIVVCFMMLNTVVYANSINIVNSNSDNYILNEDMKFTKKIVNYDRENQEIEIELLIENIKRNKNNKEDIEIALVLDNSGSMAEQENNETRKSMTYSSAKKFIKLVYKNIKKLKVETIQFSTSTQIIENFTDSLDNSLNALEAYKDSGCAGGTNTHAALEIAKSSFSSECKNKVVVLVTDGYPNSPEYTKEQLEKLEEEGIYVLSLIVCNKANIPTIQEVFGTEEAPTAGNVYYIEHSSEIDKMFNKYIYKQILNYMEHPISNIRIEDVFPKELLKYFDIEYVDEPTNGSVTNISGNNSLIWTIDEMTGEEVAVFRYKVKIKKNVDISQIIGMELKTNDGVIISYDNEDGDKKIEIFDKDPSIKVEEEMNIMAITTDIDEIQQYELPNDKKYEIVNLTPEEEKKNEEEKKPAEAVNNKTNEVPKKVVNTTITNNKPKLPQTGIKDFPIVILGVSIALSVGLGIKMIIVNKKNK